MPPRIAILGWGSLLWEERPEFDQWRHHWKSDGPSLTLEFSRISSTRLGALTLVIDARHGWPTTVAWCLSKRKAPEDAVADLRCREGCAIKDIGRLDLPPRRNGLSKHERALADWAIARKLDVIVWTALESNFESKLGRPFSVNEAVL